MYRTLVGACTIGVSACLAGHAVRYDGTDRRHHRLAELLGPDATLVTICPELELGLGVPRERIQLVDRPGGVRLVTEESRRDITADMEAFAAVRVRRSDVAGLDGFVLKSKSPSCGIGGVKLFADGGADAPYRLAGHGLFAAALARAYPELPLIEDRQLDDPAAVAAFVAAVRARAH